MKKQPKTKRATTTQTFDENGADLNPWPPPGVDPNDTKALSDALPWNQPSGMVQVPFNLPAPSDEDDGLTPEQRRAKWMRTAPPGDIEWLSRREIQKKCSSYSWDKNLGSYHHTFSRLHPRDTTAGTYVGAGEAFHRNVAKACEKGQTPDDNAMDLLLKGQPWRKAIAVAPNREQPVVTYGPMQLPESFDPIASLDAEPAVEARPTHWTPDTPVPHIISGAVHDFGNYLSALIARQVVALGFTPETEAIANARSLARTLRDFQKISQQEEETRLGRDGSPSRPSQSAPSRGRPRKATVIDPEKVLTLRLEIIERNKKFKNKKYADITLTESTPEAEINTTPPATPEAVSTTTKSTPEADLNANPLPHPE